MNIYRKSATLVAAMVAVSLAGSGSAWADRKYEGQGNAHSKAERYDHRRGQLGRADRRASGRGGYRERQHAYKKPQKKYKRNQYRDNKHYKPYKNYKHKSYRHKNYKHKSYRHNNYKHKSYARHNYYYRDDDSDENLLFGLLVGGLIGYAINSAQDNDYAYDSYPQSAPQQAPQVSVYPADARGSGTCLQEREYQTRVMVGGRSVDAYGTACLQPDGSWTRGPATLASY